MTHLAHGMFKDLTVGCNFYAIRINVSIASTSSGTTHLECMSLL